MSIKDQLGDPNLTAEERDRIIGAFVRRHAREELRARYAAELRDRHGLKRSATDSPGAGRVRKINYRILLTIAATALLVFVCFLLLPTGGTSGGEDRLLATYLAEQPAFPPVNRSTADTTARARVRGEVLTAYRAGDYPAALAAARRLDDPGNVVLYFAGSSALALDDYATARATFARLDPGGDYAEEARWFTLLLDLEMGQRERALTGLEAYREGDFYYERARKLLAEYE